MGTWVTVSITESSTCPAINDGFFYMQLENGAVISHKLSYEVAQKELKKFENLLGVTASYKINQYDSTITYRTVSGWLK